MLHSEIFKCGLFVENLCTNAYSELVRIHACSASTQTIGSNYLPPGKYNLSPEIQKKIWNMKEIPQNVYFPWQDIGANWCCSSNFSEPEKEGMEAHATFYFCKSGVLFCFLDLFEPQVL